jgi:predicted HTH transcriptional regulator
VVNAIVHADYSQRGAPVRIAFFNDRIEIENPGILLPGLTVEDMLQGGGATKTPKTPKHIRSIHRSKICKI